MARFLPDLAAELAGLYGRLPSSEEGAEYHAESPVTRSDVFFARRPAGSPVLLVQVSDEEAAGPSISTRHVRARFGVMCEVHSGGNIVQARCAVIELMTTEAVAIELFLRIVSLLIQLSPPRSSPEALRQLVVQLIELLRAADEPSRKSIQGLWGELLVIAESADAPRAVRSWHNHASDRFDFGENDQRVEVKTCVRPGRAHHFSLEQLVDPALQIWVASIAVETLGSGISIGGLVDEIKARVAPDAQLKLERIVLESLGRDWREAIGETFDRDLAETSIELFNADDIPRPSLPLPPEVSRVSFIADLTGISPVSRDNVTDLGGLIALLGA